MRQLLVSIPTHDAAIAHPNNDVGWMRKGAEPYRQIKQDYVLFGESVSSGNNRVCFETFPHAIDCALPLGACRVASQATLRRYCLLPLEPTLHDFLLCPSRIHDLKRVATEESHGCSNVSYFSGFNARGNRGATLGRDG